MGAPLEFNRSVNFATVGRKSRIYDVEHYRFLRLRTQWHAGQEILSVYQFRQPAKTRSFVDNRTVCFSKKNDLRCITLDLHMIAIGFPLSTVPLILI
jgi:hypothetical protein